MDGGCRSKIISFGIKWPNSLTIDHENKHLYWTDYLKETIEMCDFNGKDRQEFANRLSGPTSVALFSKFLYWSEWQPNVLRKTVKIQSGRAIMVIKGMKQVTKIKAVNLRKVPGL